MNIISKYGAMYAVLEEGDQIEKSPIEIGDGILYPGEFVRQLGEKERSSFSMQEGYYLRYEGRIDDFLLFGVNYLSNDGLYYAFGYVDRNILFVSSGPGSGWDIRIQKLEKFTHIEAAPIMEQLTLF